MTKPKHDCPPCPKCAGAVASPAATSGRHGVVAWNHLYCPACGHDWIELDPVAVVQAWWSRGAWDGELLEDSWLSIRARLLDADESARRDAAKLAAITCVSNAYHNGDSMAAEAAHIEILRRRERENAPEFGPLGGDGGWIFPGIARGSKRVQPVASGRPWKRDDADRLPGLHELRRTYNSVAMEIGIDRESREALMNHAGHGVNIKHYGVPQRWDHLADCQRRIEAALWERLGRVDKNTASEVESKSRAHLRVHDGGKK